MCRMKMMLIVVLCCGVPAMGVLEDFSTDPTARGWIDASPAELRWIDTSPGGYVAGDNIKRHTEEAFYRPLGETKTQDDSFDAKFDSAYRGGGATSQVVNFGFFNSDTWFTNGTPDGWTMTDMVAFHLSHWGGAPTAARFYSRLTTTSGTEYSSAAAAYANDTWFSHELVYTAGAGANNAGQLVITAYAQGDFGGTPVFTRSCDLQVGDTFAVNAFGVYSGNCSGNSTDGLRVLMDNVDVIPEPASIAVLSLGGLVTLIRRRR